MSLNLFFTNLKIFSFHEEFEKVTAYFKPLSASFLYYNDTSGVTSGGNNFLMVIS